MELVKSHGLSALNALQLKHCAFLLGLETTGSKVVLAKAIHDRLVVREPSLRQRRVVSVDMGIRNLAFCMVQLDQPNVHRGLDGKITTNMNVQAWKKIDLLAEQSFQSGDGDLTTLGKKSSKAASIPAGVFAPSSLTKIAYSVSTQLLGYKPNVILIERQRHRSGGASAILEWTVRVNMLESMLWSCLHTMKQRKTSNEAGFDMHEILPARVARFWTAGPDILLRAAHENRDVLNSPEFETTAVAKGRKKIEKKDKIEVVRSWLQGAGDVQLDLAEDVKSTADLFTTKRRSSAESFGKLDDLADCLLQAAAWARWQENGHALADVLGRHDSSPETTTPPNR